GYVYSRKLVGCLLDDPRGGGGAQRGFIVASTALILTTSSYMLWRAVIGHYTAYPMYLVLGLIYYSLRALQGPLSRGQWVAAILLGWVYYSTGFYFSLVYLWLPFALSVPIALGLVLGTRVARGEAVAPVLGSLCRVALLNVACLIPGLYKAIPVVLHHL